MMKSRTSAMPALSYGALASAALLALGAALPSVAVAQTRGAASAANARVAPPAALAAAAHPSRAFWLDIRETPAATSAAGARVAVNASRARMVTLDKLSLAGLLQAAPAERSAAARQRPLVMVLPDPAGGFQRFAVVDSPVMEAGLAARHPDIKT